MPVVIHDSDCATHNEPALRNGPCDCSVSRTDPVHADIIDRVGWLDGEKDGEWLVVDEIVATGVDIHIEKLHDGLYWMSITKGDATHRQVVTFRAGRSGKCYCRTEAD